MGDRQDGVDLLGRQNSRIRPKSNACWWWSNGMVGHHFVEQLVAAGGLERFEM